MKSTRHFNGIMTGNNSTNYDSAPYFGRRLYAFAKAVMLRSFMPLKSDSQAGKSEEPGLFESSKKKSCIDRILQRLPVHT